MGGRGAKSGAKAGKPTEGALERSLALSSMAVDARVKAARTNYAELHIQTPAGLYKFYWNGANFGDRKLSGPDAGGLLGTRKGVLEVKITEKDIEERIRKNRRK